MSRSFQSGLAQRIDTAGWVDVSGGAAFSIACWLKSPVGAVGGLAPWTINNTGNATYFGLLNDVSSPFIKVQGNMRDTGSGSGDQPLCNGIVFDDTWHHICVTQPSGSSILSYYLDGLLDTTFARTSLSNGAYSPNTFCIGASNRSSGVSNNFDGLLAHLALWSRTLSASEISSLGKGLSPSFFSPNHYYPLWGVDSPEPDYGISARANGSHVNGPLQGSSGPPILPSLLKLAA